MAAYVPCELHAILKGWVAPEVSVPFELEPLLPPESLGSNALSVQSPDGLV